MTNDPQIEALYDAGEAQMPEEDDSYPLRAIRTMPFYGQVIAWFSWRAPYVLYLLVIVGGIVWCFFDEVGKGIGTTLTGVLALVWSWWCRTNQPDPWKFTVLIAKQPVPGDLRAAAAQGAPVPPENPHREEETQT